MIIAWTALFLASVWFIYAFQSGVDQQRRVVATCAYVLLMMVLFVYRIVKAKHKR